MFGAIVGYTKSRGLKLAFGFASVPAIIASIGSQMEMVRLHPELGAQAGAGLLGMALGFEYFVIGALTGAALCIVGKEIVSRMYD